MRRWVAALGLSLVLALTGCAGTHASGVPKDSSPSPSASAFRPAAGTCHAKFDQVAALSEAKDYEPVPCAGPHMGETLAVFDLTPAQEASSESRLIAAYSECSKRAAAWLGNDWRTGWTTILPMLPGSDGVSGGARWVRCDVAEVAPTTRRAIERRGSMRNTLKPAGKLAMTCMNTNKDATDLRAAACSAKHNAEFAGLYVSKAKDPQAVSRAELDKGCRPVIAKYAGVPKDDVGWLSLPPDDVAWYQGDHAIRCFWYETTKVTGSHRA